MDKLKEKARKLGIKFDDDVEKDDLQKLIDDKEEEIAQQNNDADYLKKELDKWKAEAKKAFEKRDTVNADKTALKNKVKKMEEQMKNMTDSDSFKELKEQFDDLKKFKEDFDKKREKEKLDKMDEIERLKLESKKESEKLSKKMDDLKASFEKEKQEKDEALIKADKKISRLRKSTLGVDIMKAAVKMKSWNPEQVVRLVRDDLTYDKDVDRYSYIKRDEKGKLVDELSVEEYVTDFLKREENENLIKSDANTSSFHSDKDKTLDKTHTKSGKYNPKDADIIREAEDRDMTPERYIKTLEKRDAWKEEKEGKSKE